MKKTLISVVVPVYSAESYLQDLCQALEKENQNYTRLNLTIQISEVIFVVDQAIDNSIEILRGLEKRYRWLRVIELAKNFGQHPATIAGISHSSGDWVVTLDEDLQHHPKHIVDMLLLAVGKSFDIVYAKPKSQVHDGVFRNFFSRQCKLFMAKLSALPNVTDFNSFRLVRGSVARASAASVSHGVYYDVALHWFSSKVGTVSVELRDTRHSNTKKSGYTFGKLISHAKSLFQSSHLRITRFLAVLSLSISLLSACYIAYIFATKLFGLPTEIPRGWASQMCVILFFGGATIFILTLIFEYISLLLAKSLGRPLYFIIDRSGDGALQQSLRKLVETDL